VPPNVSGCWNEGARSEPFGTVSNRIFRPQEGSPYGYAIAAGSASPRGTAGHLSRMARQVPLEWTAMRPAHVVHGQSSGAGSRRSAAAGAWPFGVLDLSWTPRRRIGMQPDAPYLAASGPFYGTTPDPCPFRTCSRSVATGRLRPDSDDSANQAHVGRGLLRVGHCVRSSGAQRRLLAASSNRAL